MQQAMESLSRDDSQQRDRDPERSKRRESSGSVAEGRMSREDDASAESLIGTEPRGVAKAMSYQRRALTI